MATIPAKKYGGWKKVEGLARSCTGGPGRYWLVNVTHLPSQIKEDSVCYMVCEGFVRGYFNIVDTGPTESFRNVHRIGKKRTTQSIVLANWHPIDPVEQKGFQAYRYTQLSPLL